MSTKQAIANLVLEGKTKEAIDLVLTKYPADNAMATYMFYTQIKRSIYLNNANRNPDYDIKLRWLLSRDLSAKDANKVRAALQLSLQEQNALHKKKTAYLSNPDMNRLFKAIKPIVDPYYHFVLPKEIVDQYTKARNAKMVEGQMRTTQPSEYYQFSATEMNVIADTAINHLSVTTMTKPLHWYNMVVALEIVTGRRAVEVCSTMVLSPTSHPYQAYVTGLAKQTGSPTTAIIPLLAPYDQVNEALQRMRAFRSTYAQGNVTTNSATATVRLFGRKLVHTQKRGIYAEVGYQRRHQSEFFPTASKIYWTSQALVHGTKTAPLGATPAYMVFDINQTVSSSTSKSIMPIPVMTW